MARPLKFSTSAPAADLTPQSEHWAKSPFVIKGILTGLDWSVVTTLALLFILGFGLRFTHLGAIGFAEDEMNKLDAVHSYNRGDISANGEHPMLMKALMYVSLHAAGVFDRDGSGQIGEEAALRFPNALFGALTVIPLFLLTLAFFDRWTALLAAAFWSFGINAITFNRIGKEDTLLVFFMLFAFYFYLRAKQITPHNVPGRRRNYILSACSFGLMMASKYFPHYFGLNALYHHMFRVRKAEPGDPSGRAPRIFYVLIGVVFLIANPSVLLPYVWSYLASYMGERLLVHTGYFFNGQLYMNTMSGTPFWGTPIYFYALFMAIKIPLLVLGAFVIGVYVALRNRTHPGNAFVLFMLFFWLVPYSLAGAKWLRYTLSLMPFVYMAAAIGTVALVRFVSDLIKARSAQYAVAVLAAILFVGVPGLIAYANGPHYALYTNALAAGRSGHFFPHDEFYDDGLREAIKFVCDTAPPGATIAHETPAVTRYYLGKFNRADLNSRAMSAPDFDPQKLNGPTYLILQNGRIYFENQAKLDYVRGHFKKVHEVKINALTAAEVFVNQ